MTKKDPKQRSLNKDPEQRDHLETQIFRDEINIDKSTSNQQQSQKTLQIRETSYELSANNQSTDQQQPNQHRLAINRDNKTTRQKDKKRNKKQEKKDKKTQSSPTKLSIDSK